MKMMIRRCTKLCTQISSRSVATIPYGPGVGLNKVDQNDLIAVEKPVGVMSHPNDSATKASLSKSMKETLVGAEYIEKGEYYAIAHENPARKKLYLLNRLDSATSGLILLTFNKDVASNVKKQFSSRLVKKSYVGVVFGHPQSKAAIWNSVVRVCNSNSSGELRLVRARQSERKKHSGVKVAETHVRVLKKFHVDVPIENDLATTKRVPMSVLELRPVTGYTHQLRYQCAEHGLPIVGDRKYGSFAMNRALVKFAKEQQKLPESDRERSWLVNSLAGGLHPRMLLHCSKVSLKYECAHKKRHKFKATSNTLEDMIPDTILPPTSPDISNSSASSPSRTDT